jgi:hypothetical protein
MAQIFLFPRTLTEPKSKSDAAPSSSEEVDVPPCGEVIEWCLMILDQTNESELRIPLAKTYSPNTVYEAIVYFAARGWLVTSDGPRALNFRLK